MLKPINTILLIALVFTIALAGVSPTGLVADMEHSVHHFLGSLDHHHHSKATFDFEDEERYNFHFIPRTRKGVALKDLSPGQRKLAHALLSSALDRQGKQTVERIMYLEQILYELENQSPRRDPDAYFISIFGKPGAKSWGWRFEGHHLSLNFTVKDGKAISASPAFFGANPAEVRDGPHKGLRVLSGQEDLGRRLVKSLDQTLQNRAIIFEDAPDDIYSAALREAKIEAPLGLSVASMSDSTRQILKDLLSVYGGQFREELSKGTFWKRIEVEGIENLHFAWAGGTEPGQRHYYKIQGKSFLIEYDNTQNDANHIHSVWRDLENDFGGDPLTDHYQQSH